MQIQDLNTLELIDSDDVFGKGHSDTLYDLPIDKITRAGIAHFASGKSVGELPVNAITADYNRRLQNTVPGQSEQWYDGMTNGFSNVFKTHG